jgi:hypothetical protein
MLKLTGILINHNNCQQDAATICKDKHTKKAARVISLNYSLNRL